MERDLPPYFEPDRWVPPPGSVEDRRLWRFMRRHGFDDYQAFLDQARDPHWFYPRVIEDLGLDWPVPYTDLMDTSDGLPWTRWFVGGRTNLAWLAVHRWVEAGHGDRPALVWDGEDGQTATLTYADVATQVRRMAAGLSAAGVRQGDVVAIYMPMVPTAMVAVLAAAHLGAVAAPAFSGYGVEALAERLQIAEATTLMTSDGTYRNGKQVDLLSVAREAVDRSPSVQRVFVHHRLPSSLELRDRELDMAGLLDAGSLDEPVLLEPEAPVYLGFTSGSSGRPKGIVHCHGRFPYRLPIEIAYNYDVHPGELFAWITDMGWIMGPGMISGVLIAGAGFLMIEGGLTTPGPDRLWRSIETHGVTHLGLSPTAIRMLAEQGEQVVEAFDMPTLRVVGTSGEPMTPDAWRWAHRHICRGVAPIINISGGTEIGAGLLVGAPVVPMRECRFAGISPGMDVAVFDGEGREVVGEEGELVIRRPFPSMTYGFWKEPERYEETYWSRWPGVWVHGDRAVIFEDGSAVLPGRSDDVMNVGGKRVGPSEYESIATSLDDVTSAAAVGVPDPVKGEVAVLLITAVPGSDEGSLAARIRERVDALMGKAMRPKDVIVVSILPLTVSGKVHRRAIRAWLTGTDPGDLSGAQHLESRAEIARHAARIAAPPYTEGASA
ncbi:MAG: AMP-binding protein [Actinomycetota bacterium]